MVNTLSTDSRVLLIVQLGFHEALCDRFSRALHIE